MTGGRRLKFSLTALSRNFPSVGYSMENRFTLGERVVDK
jgi:hypothetical protein